MKSIKFKNKFKKLFRKDNWHLFLLFGIFLFFILRGIELALTIEPGIAPDERWHVAVSRFYSDTRLFLQDNPETYRYGPISRAPFLFHLVLGNILKIYTFESSQIVFLRLLNLLFSIINVIFIYKLARLLTKNKLVALLAVIIATNITMYTFLSSSVSYDNLVNLFSTLSIYYLVEFYKSSKTSSLLLILIFLSLGITTKITAIPLAASVGFAMLIILTWKIFKQGYLTNIKTSLSYKIIPFVVFLLLTLLGVYSYIGINYLNYGTIRPKCDQVLTYEQCLENPIFARGPQLQKVAKEVRFDRVEYIGPWSELMLERTFGIFGHKNLYKSEEFIRVYSLILVFSIIGIIRAVSPKRKEFLILLWIILFNVLVLMYYQNYKTYSKHGLIDVALQGRYIFTILAPLVVVISFSLIKMFKSKYIQIVIFLIVSSLFIYGDYFHFKRNVPDNWYLENQISEKSKELNLVFRRVGS